MGILQKIYSEKDQSHERERSVEVGETGYVGDGDLKAVMSNATGTIPANELGTVFSNFQGGIIASHSDEKSTRNLPLKHYKHFASLQRSYEERRDWEGLKKEQELQLSNPHSNLSPEKIESQRALRKATIPIVFLLIIGDTLGPGNAPYAISVLGLVPGIILYIAFGMFAILGGYFLQQIFLKLDSDNFPIRTFADLAGRVLGPWCRYAMTALQFLQLILMVGVSLLTCGQSLAQLIKSTAEDPKLCFTVQVLVWALLGMVVGQIRRLSGIIYVSNIGIWAILASCIVAMVGAARGPPNYNALIAGGLITPEQVGEPIRVVAATGNNLSQNVQGVGNLIYAWAGATMFCEIMAEMKRPKDFLKGQISAQFFILAIYLVFGVFIYCYQGQFTDNPGNQGISQYNLQSASNICYLVACILACVLYANIGLKVLYQGVGVPDLKFPPLITKRGRLLWGVLIVVYWAVTFVIGCAIPQVASLSSLIGSLCIANFSFTFPFLFMLTLMLREDAGTLDEYDPSTATVSKHDTWREKTRWRRAILGGGRLRLLWKILLVLLVCASLCVSALGMYGSIETMILVYSQKQGPVFGCAPTA